MEKIFAQGRRFVDSQGRERILYGVNIVDKRKGPDTKFEFEIDDALLTKMRDHGFNVLRLGTTWSMIEPQPGQYNDEYLDDMARILDRCEKYGVHVFLDMHQDLYSPMCYGDGAPDWATMTDGAKAKPIKLVWAEGYFWRKAVHRAFDNFWANKEYNGKGLLDYFADMWVHVAQRLGNHPAVFGFDMLNEPYPGTDGGKVFRGIIRNAVKTVLFDRRVKFTKLVGAFINKEKRERVAYLDQITGDVIHDVMLKAGGKHIGNFDTERYSPFINKVSTALRNAGMDGLLFLENCYWSNTCVPCSTYQIEVNGKRDNNFCFSPHGYDFMVDTPQYKYASSDRVEAIFSEHRRTQERLDVPVLVGEWGGFGGGGDEWLPHIEFLLNFFEKNKWSFTYWHFINDLFESPLCSVLSRPYPMVTPGEIKAYGYNRENSEFHFEWQLDEPSDDQAVVFLHKTPVEIDCDCEYSKEELGEKGACKLYIKAAPGAHSLKVKF